MRIQICRPIKWNIFWSIGPIFNLGRIPSVLPCLSPPVGDIGRCWNPMSPGKNFLCMLQESKTGPIHFWLDVVKVIKTRLCVFPGFLSLLLCVFHYVLLDCIRAFLSSFIIIVFSWFFCLGYLPVQVIDRKDSSLKWPTLCWWRH